MPDECSRKESALDRALDGALADLTAMPAPRDLRERVLARLASRHARPRPLLRAVRWSVALPAAATVAAVVWSGFWLTRRANTPVAGDPPPPVAGGSPSATPVAPPPVEPSVRAPAPGAPGRAPRAGQPRAAAAPREALPAAATSGRVAVEVPPSTAVDDPDALPPLDPPAPVAPAELYVASTREPAPIDVPSLRVAPLTPAADDGSTLP